MSENRKTTAENEGHNDAVDDIMLQWQTERPELVLDGMLTVGRLKRCAALMQNRLGTVFSSFDLCAWEFDVLATLRRSGTPYTLAPTVLFSKLMITSGTMTHRMKRLEARGFIRRVPNPDDSRSLLVQMTESGIALTDAAVTAHVDNMESMLEPISRSDQVELDRLLKQLLAILEHE
jgi:DNA-binding MarR family transcriptional regulator